MNFNIHNYPGSKGGNGTFQNIINHIPPHDTYLEPFFGSGAIFFNKKLSMLSLVGDTNQDVIKQHIFSDAFNEFYDWSNGNPNSFSFMKNSNIVTLLSQDYKETIEMSTDSPNRFIYLDPPYLKSTRKSEANIYTHEWTESDHIDFLDYVNKINCPVMISCYDNFIYELYLDGWNKFTFTSMTRNGPALETIYMNYPKPTELHDYRYVGKNMTDRQRIQRKVNRHIKKLYNLPALERNKLLNEIKYHFDLCGTMMISKDKS